MATDKHDSLPRSGYKFGPHYSREDLDIYQTFDKLQRLQVAILFHQAVPLTDAITQVALGIPEPLPDQLDLDAP